MSALALLSAAAAASWPTRRFPFGLQAATPLAVGVQGAALVGTLLYASADAVTLIREGGDAASPGSVLAYGAVSAAWAVAVSWRLARVSGSDIVVAEVAQWRASGWLSGVIALGGGVGVALDGTSWDDAVAYVDPVLVLVACALAAPTAYHLLRQAALELLQAAPPPDVQRAIDDAVAAAVSEFSLPEPNVAATKLGRRLYVDVRFVVAEGWDVAREDRVRHAVIDRLELLDLEVWANVELTMDADLAE
jgi:predicted Co/Zn/Cd cation transporter (cation efflux family)